MSWGQKIIQAILPQNICQPALQWTVLLGPTVDKGLRSNNPRCGTVYAVQNKITELLGEA